MGHGEGHSLYDFGVLQQRLVHFPRRYLFAATVDDLLEAAGDVEVAVLIHPPLIAGAEPSVGIGLAICLRVAFITRCDVGAADDDLTRLPRR